MAAKRKTGNVTSPPTPVDIPNRVKTAILITYGQDNPDPASLLNTAAMSGFGFTDYQWMILAGRLTKIVNQPGQKVTVPELQSTTTVQDCIDLVIRKSTLP